MENEKGNIVENEVVIGIPDEHREEIASRKAGELHSEEEHTVDESLEEEQKSVDYSSFSKNDFVQLLKELSTPNNFRHIDEVVKEVKPLLDELRNKQRHDALEKFKAEGGKLEDFDYKQDEFDSAFDATLRLIRDRKTAYYKGLEDEKNENLKRKTEILEKLRALVD
jgi:hypothetical protein